MGFSPAGVLVDLAAPLDLLAKATLLVLVAAIASRFLRRQSASARHSAWALGVAGVLALPLVAPFVSTVHVDLGARPSVDSRADAGAVSRDVGKAAFAAPASSRTETAGRLGSPGAVAKPEPAPRRATGAMGRHGALLAFTLAWTAGSAAALGRLVAAMRKVRGLVRRGRHLSACPELDAIARWAGIRRAVRLVASEGVAVPMTFGAVRPAIIVPADFATWEPSRRREVLLHELAHVRRNDWLLLCVARLATVIYWFHPLVRLAERRMRQEAELAADDFVLSHGTRPSSYAEHLLSLVRSLRVVPRSNAMAVSMFGGPFDGRIRAILDPARPRGPVPVRVSAALAGVAALVFALCCSVSVGAKPEKRSAWRDLHEALTATLHPPHGASGWYDRGMSLHRSGEYDRAIEAFEKAIAAGHDGGAAEYNIACGHARMRRTDLALEWLEKAVAAGFDVSPYVHRDQDLASLRDDPRFTRFAEAHADADEVAALRAMLDDLRVRSSKDADEWAEAGLALHYAGRYDQAVEALSKAVELDGDSSRTIYNLACAKSLAGDRAGALDALERAVEAGWDDADHAEEDADLDPVREDPRFASILASIELLALPRDVSFMGLDLDASQEDWRAATKRHETYLRDHPRSGRAWFRLGLATLRLGEPARAAEAFRKAYDIGHRRSFSAYNVACSHSRAGRIDAAFEWLERAVAEGFDSPGHVANDDDLEALRDDPRFAKYEKGSLGSRFLHWF